MQNIIVLITTPNNKEAKSISKILLDRQLAACVNIIRDMDSYFLWKGKKERAKENLLICKTTKNSLKGIIKTVRSIHSYEVPEIIAVPIIGGNKPYLDWIKHST